MPSPQSLSEADRCLVATWAADCAERVLDQFLPRTLTATNPMNVGLAAHPASGMVYGTLF